MRIGIVGCGYVADFYLSTMPNHPELELAGVVDQDGGRARRFAKRTEPGTMVRWPPCSMIPKSRWLLISLIHATITTFPALPRGRQTRL